MKTMTMTMTKTNDYKQLRRHLQTFLKWRTATMKPPAEYAYLGMEDFLLQHGREYQPVPLPKEIQRGMAKQCFHNARKLARQKKWLYVEGMAFNGNLFPFSIHHGWCVNPAKPDIAIDPTWKDGPHCYIGVPFNLGLITKLHRNGTTILDDFVNGYPLYTGKLTEEEWRHDDSLVNLQRQKAFK